MGPITFDPRALRQRHDDFAYLCLDHSEMYVNFATVGPLLLGFFEQGRFPDDARRTMYNCDPFGHDDDTPCR